MTDLVTVIIPAYNAGETIDRTLHSVRQQSWTALDIIVVDDGSTDDTIARVEAHRADDPRIRLVSQANGGVAAARNHGIALAKSDLIAPVDADDLWRSDKIALQVAAMRAGGDQVGLVYCWFTLIDDADRIIGYGDRWQATGDVVQRMCLGNIVGNGSSPLIRRDVLLAAGGYDPGLRAQRAQGCEDFKLYFDIAERCHFAVVPQFLVGYRWTEANMSSDWRQMLRSYDLVIDAKRDRYPQFSNEFSLGRKYLINWLYDRILRRGTLAAAGTGLLQLRREWPRGTLPMLRKAVRASAKRYLGRSRPASKTFETNLSSAVGE